jgi:hypothetical protein
MSSFRKRKKWQKKWQHLHVADWRERKIKERESKLTK